MQPDVQVIPGAPRRGDWESFPAPLLVIEVLSGSSRRFDLGVKLDAYSTRVGVQTVWIVDHKLREFHVLERGRAPIVERETVQWHPSGAPHPLAIDVKEFFRNALGE
ncbi:MAG: Uma2 family endonuclease [Gemmatimonadetes bacterium]|nr:Uma2 family endonuclease [Gemmatimonadota bacterium]